MSGNYKYPLIVWLSSAAFGTIASHITSYIHSYFTFLGRLEWDANTLQNLFLYFITIFIIAFFASIPSWLCFWFVYAKLSGRFNTFRSFKWFLVALSQVLCWGLFAIVFLLVGLTWSLWGTNTIVALPYAIVTGLSTWYLFPKPTLEYTNGV